MDILAPIGHWHTLCNYVDKERLAGCRCIFMGKSARELGMVKLITIFVIMFTHNSWATVISGANECPIQFEGRVREIIRPVGPTDIFSVDRVIFENDHSIKGNIPDRVALEILQNGPFHLEIGRDYKVHVRSGKVCWIEEL